MNTLTLSPTGVQTFLSCPKKFFLSRMGFPRTVTSALAIGSAVHRGAEVLMGALRAKRRPIEVIDEAEATLIEALELECNLGSPDPDDAGFETAKETALGLLRAVAEAIPEDWDPVAVEEAVEMPIAEGVTLRGYTDVVLSTGEIIDFKTRKRRSPESEIRHNLQMTAYAALKNHADGLGDSPRKITVMEIVKTKTPACIMQRTERTKEDFAAYRELVIGVAAAIQQGHDYPNPSAYCRFCNYREHCSFGTIGAAEEKAA
jgi:CRISPR/Cas system-associated exonuclease Cas4 (RecB family)